MNKSSVMISFVLCLLVLTSFSIAANNTTITNTTTNTTAVVVANINGSKIDKAFNCLATQVKADCSGVNKIQDIALTILASPSGVTQKCYDKLIGLKRTDCFGDSSCNVKDTAFAILAINHVGQDTKNYENWLKNQTKIATDLVWYLEQDSIGKTGCKVSYDSVDYPFNVLENKKIETAAGNCLSLAQSNYWFQVSPNCYNKKFTIVCDANYIATLLYKQPSSATLYILSGTKSAQASQPIELNIKSSCFGSNGCDYEASAWATIALEKTGNEIEDYVPYLIAGEEANQKYLPAAFLQILKDFSEYGTKLIQQQKLNNWEAENTAYNKYYDTGLALLALTSSNQQKVVDSKNWLLNIAQDANGCWNNNNIRDTAIILWALEGRRTTVIGATAALTGCSEAGFFCITTDQCPSGDLLPNYYCSALGKKCCKTENLQTCEELGGKTCATGMECTGNIKNSKDVSSCCLGECEKPVQETACEQAKSVCRTTCLDTQKKDVSLDCGDKGVCCTNIATPASGSSWWIWLLIILIILVVLAIIFREKLKIWIYKVKSGFKEDKGKTNNNFGGVSPGMGPYSTEKPTQQRPPVRPLQLNTPQRPFVPQRPQGQSPQRR